MQSIARLVLLVPFAAAGGCMFVAPTPPAYASIEVVRDRLERAAVEAEVMPDDPSAATKLLMYLPNRLLDVLDIVRVEVGLGPGVAFEIYLSENIWISYLNHRSWRLGLDGRSGGFFDEGHFREWHLSDWHGSDEASSGRIPLWATTNLRPFESPLRPGVPAVADVGKNAWDIGAQAHVLVVGVAGLVRPFEILDFIVGLWGDDLAVDDFGVRDYPLHEYAVQGEVVDQFIDALDRMDEQELRQVLSRDLALQSRMRRKDQVILLGDNRTLAAPPLTTAVGDAGDDYVILGDVELRPSRFRDAASGRLELSVRCTGIHLRWGVPAQITYELELYNRFLGRAETYRLHLRIENRAERNYWVIHRIRAAEGPGSS